YSPLGISGGASSVKTISADSADILWNNRNMSTDLSASGWISHKPDGNNAAIITFALKQSPPYADREIPLTRGISVYPEMGGSWDMSKYKSLHFTVENLNKDRQCGLLFRLNSKWSGTLGYAILRPGEKRTISYRLKHEGKFGLGFRTYGVPNGLEGTMNVDTSQISSIQICRPGVPDNKIRLSRIHVTGNYVRNPATKSEEAFFPFVDRYGQYIHSNWSEKVKNNSDFTDRLKEENAILKKRIACWNKYGGWENGPQLKATGFFRTEKYKGKWYLVDPEGKLFFSNGINAVTNGGVTKVTAAKKRCFSNDCRISKNIIGFNLDNIKIKYGNDLNKFYDMMNRRFDSWGINTIGNWSNKNIIQKRKHPYVIEWQFPFTCCPFIAGNLPDIYSKEFEQWVKTPFLKSGWNKDKSYSVNDPWCIGVFIGNESPIRTETLVAEKTFVLPAERPAKKELIRQLKNKYKTVEELNKTWGSEYSDWDVVLNSKELPDTNKSKSDFYAFSKAYIHRLFRLCRDGVKKNSPNTLFLGHRFTVYESYLPFIGEAASKYFDVASYNLYLPSFDRFAPAGLGDKPYIITETTVGHLARGMFATLCNAGDSPNSREEAQRRRFEGLLNNPQIVGIHHFALWDQPITARGMDSENYCFGFLDCVDTPYQSFADENRRISEKMYDYRLNKNINNNL
ncbi:MAG: beta-galactosidase, partial [Victivallales bacterium]|nr:beta-galactosidase [Victivallales bacterium]